jgi:hypothetical protein
MSGKFILLWIVCAVTNTITGQILKVGQVFEDGIIAHVNQDGKSGLLVTEYNILNKPITWNEAAKTSNEIGYWSGLNVVWRLPTCYEMQLIHKNLYLTNLMEFALDLEMDPSRQNFWVSDRDSKNNQLPQHFSFDDGTCWVGYYTIPPSDEKYIEKYYLARAVRSFKKN